MGQMTREQILAMLASDNPRLPLATASLYADAFCQYCEATSNITAHGSIVLHPRTGQPIDNPYLKIQASAKRSLERLHVPRTTALWQHLADELRSASPRPTLIDSPTPPRE